MVVFGGLLLKASTKRGGTGPEGRKVTRKEENTDLPTSTRGPLNSITDYSPTIIRVHQERQEVLVTACFTKSEKRQACVKAGMRVKQK